MKFVLATQNPKKLKEMSFCYFYIRYIEMIFCVYKICII